MAARLRLAAAVRRYAYREGDLEGFRLPGLSDRTARARLDLGTGALRGTIEWALASDRWADDGNTERITDFA